MSTNRCTTLDPSLSYPQTSPESFLGKLQSAAIKAFDVILVWQERAAQRAQLASLDNHMLRDVGLSRADVEKEASLPFWRVR